MTTPTPVLVEMTKPDTGETFARRYPATRRRHDMLRNLATFALAQYNHTTGTWVRLPRNLVRVNSVQGVAWDVRDVANVAYFTPKG